MTRHVYSTRDITQAADAVAALHRYGIERESVSLVARSDIQLESIPDSMIEAGTDAVPAAIRGMGMGGAIGLLAGLVAIPLAPIGITLAGAAAIGAAGALVGGWSSALMGSALPDPVRQQFEDEIEAGRVLVLVDVEEDDDLPAVQSAMDEAGAVELPYSSPVGAK